MLKLPEKDCGLCPRLVEFRRSNEALHPSFFNGAVPSFGDINAAKLVVIGLAPGLKGANQTGRPFTGDYAGDTLYEALLRNGLASGDYAKHADDGLQLNAVRITNVVRCVPPENKPEASEVNNCNPFLLDELAAMPALKVMIALGGISHKATLRTLGLKQKDHPFGHGAEHNITLADGRDIILLDSYHCSRYNVNTKRLTEEMFDGIIARAKELMK